MHPSYRDYCIEHNAATKETCLLGDYNGVHWILNSHVSQINPENSPDSIGLVKRIDSDLRNFLKREPSLSLEKILNNTMWEVQQEMYDADTSNVSAKDKPSCELILIRGLNNVVEYLTIGNLSLVWIMPDMAKEQIIYPDCDHMLTIDEHASTYATTGRLEITDEISIIICTKKYASLVDTNNAYPWKKLLLDDPVIGHPCRLENILRCQLPKERDTGSVAAKLMRYAVDVDKLSSK